MLKNYASYFVSHLLNNLKNINNIERIILYGSVAKDQDTKNSDIDLFIEIKDKTKKSEKEIKKIEKDFYQSRESALFKSKEINNKFSIKIGKLKEWKELSRSIASTGIILYGPYETKELPTTIRHFIIIFFNKIGKNRGSFLNKIYGVNINGKYYEGWISKINGKRLGKSCVMIPIEYKNDIFKLLKEYKVEAKNLEVFF